MSDYVEGVVLNVHEVGYCKSKRDMTIPFHLLIELACRISVKFYSTVGSC